MYETATLNRFVGLSYELKFVALTDTLDFTMIDIACRPDSFW